MDLKRFNLMGTQNKQKFQFKDVTVLILSYHSSHSTLKVNLYDRRIVIRGIRETNTVAG